jgi:acid phosphatase family membrane protein YuiD
MIMDIITNQIIVSVVFAMVVCNTWKTIDSSIRKKRHDLKAMFRTGGMPSAHAALVTALAVSIGLVEGFLSTVFLLTLGIATIVIRDALGVRRHVDHLAKTVNEIIKVKKLTINGMLKITGHTPVQVVTGILIGIIVPIVINTFY